MSQTYKYHPVKKRIGVSSQLRYYKHHTFPGLNQYNEEYNILNDDEDILDFYKPFPYRFGQPIPVMTTKNDISNEVLNGYNAVLELPKRKFAWKLKKKNVVNQLRLAMKKNDVISSVVNYIKDNPSDISSKQPCALAAVGDHLSKNPDKYFSGHYNWYFANCISSLYVNGKHFVLSVAGKNFNTVGIARLKVKKIEKDQNQLPLKIDPHSRLFLENRKPIYEVVTSKTSGLNGIRQRDICSFFSINEDEVNGELCIKQCQSVTNIGYPFVSMDIRDEEFCAVSANRMVKLWTPEYSKKCVLESTVPPPKFKTSDKFLTAKYCIFDPNIIAMIDRASIFYYDKRLGLDNPSSIWLFHKQAEVCEEASLILQSCSPNYWYIALTHSVFLLDIRKGLVQKWTHMLPFTPSIGCVQKISSREGEDELVFLATQPANDVVCIYNGRTDGVVKSGCVPLSVPNRTDTLLSAKSNGICLDPSLNCRFEQSTIGLTSYKKKKQIGLLSSTVIGDIFYQKIQPRMTDTAGDDDNNIQDNRSDYRLTDVVHNMSASDIAYLSKWESNYSATSSCVDRYSQIHCTDIVDMQELFDHIDVSDIGNPEPEPSRMILKPAWKISKEEVESYNDLLAANIIDDFGMREQSEWGSASSVEAKSNDEDETPVTPKDADSQNKVMSWLENHPFDAAPDELQLDEPNPNSDEDDDENLGGISVSAGSDSE